MIAELKPYQEFKESGLPWLGKVPGHWNVKRAKSIFQRIDERSKTGKEELLTVSSARGIVPRKSANVTMFKAESYLGYKLCWPGDLVINSLWAWAGGLGVSRHHGIVSSAYGIYRIRQDAPMIPAFVHEVVRSSSFNWELRVRSKGVWISRLQLTDISFLDAPMHIPPSAEQAAIVRFLDWANGRLERAIRAKRKVIALLNEQKQAIIHRAVTRGLDPAVPLKRSGSRWFPELPAGWEALTLRRVITSAIDGPHFSPQYQDAGIPFLSARNVRADRWILSDAKFISEADFIEFSRRVRPEVGDVLYTKGGTTGVARAVDLTFPFQVWVHIAVLKLKRDRMVPAFLAYCLNSPRCYEQAQLFTRGATNQDLGLGRMKDIELPVPPTLGEQNTIVDFLDSECSAFTTAISRLEREIELLREYRTRLVADVVTGKLDVRDAVARLPDEVPLDTTVDDGDVGEESGAAEEEAAA
ncbi:MAG: restriction endonuclease subunit S [Burkholderiales bacterium]